ncbi:putative aspartate aminotransferase [Macroventuria anomochaeta]|uniref:Aspartate aminotransferase n=1 Tax=Macroventuria anomochaeta TaxID=301207 RepID=A0ACB6RPS7_9PLEO|nr:putative aspartate aminotransferase [Macroventuria anomochaeta]KAF2623960.1 putative aspartate aminotransferase [Macroventuria anomochaeta]
MVLSPRGQANADQLSIPWRFAKSHTYDSVTNPTGLISFATAENCLFQEELHDFISKIQIPSAALRYAFSTAGGPRLPSAFATHVNEYFAPYWEVGGTDVRVTAAATSLHDVLAYSLCKEGEGILTSRPYYGRFELDFGNKAGVKLVSVDTDHEECFGEGVVQAFEEAFKENETRGVKIRAVLIVNPHNPLGKCYPQATLVALMRFCHLHALHFIADEVYALSVFPNPSYPSATPFTSALSIDPTGIIDPNLIHATYGLSKDFGLAGLKVGCLITRNEELKRAVTAVQRFSGVSGLSVAVATSMLEEREWVREIVGLSRSRLAQAYTLITGRLKQIGIAFLEGGNAGFFVWVDLSPWLPPRDDEGSEDERMVLARKFVKNGVFLQPGEEHGRVGWFRVVFSLKRGVVEEGLRRIEETLKEVSW